MPNNPFNPIAAKTRLRVNGTLDVRQQNMNPYDEIERRIRDAQSLTDAAAVLEELLSGGYSVWTDGSLYNIRQLVERINGLRIEVYSDEHAPPHFHVSAPDIDAVFSVKEGAFIRGDIDGRNRRLIEWWYQRSREQIVAAWNATRPADCPVGPVE
jgi:hypothetical protein